MCSCTTQILVQINLKMYVNRGSPHRRSTQTIDLCICPLVLVLQASRLWLQPTYPTYYPFLLIFNFP